MNYSNLKLHEGHKLTVETSPRTDTIPATARIKCLDCDTILIQEVEYVVKPFNPYPKSSTKGGKPILGGRR